MTVRIQGCVRTAYSGERGDSNLLYGLLTLPGGAWYFGYDVTGEEVQLDWVPSITPLAIDPAATSVLFRVWNISSGTLNENPDTKALGVQPVLEKEIDIRQLADSAHIFRQSLSLELDEFLVFGFEGTGPALGEQENRSEDGFFEKLSIMRAINEKIKKLGAAKISSLQATFGAEKGAMQREFDAEKARLQDEFKAKEAELQNEMQDKVRDLEQRLENTLEELGQANKAKERVEKLCSATKDAENSLKEENLQVSQERDEIEAKFQELENEEHASKQALQDAIAANEKQASSITMLESENADIGAELAKLQETMVPENKRLTRHISLLQETLKVNNAELEDERTKGEKIKARLAWVESDSRRLGQELRTVNNSLAQSENTRSRLEWENERATARLIGLEDEASKRQEQIEQLTQNLREEKASREVTSSELGRLKELMEKELSDAEKNISDLHLKIAGLEKRVDSTTAEKDDLNKVNLELKDHLSHEKAELQGAEKTNEQLRVEIGELKGRVNVAEEQVSMLESDLSAAENQLGSNQTALKDEGERHSKLLDELGREKTKCAEVEGRLEALEATTGTKISKLTDDLENARADTKQISDSYDSMRAELEKTKQELATADFQFEKQERQLRAESGRTEKLKAELDKAFQRWLDYDKEHLYEQLENERQAHGRCREVLETIKAEHAANVRRLESEVRRLDGETGSRDDRMRQQADSIADFERMPQEQPGVQAALELKIRDLETEVTRLGASLADEHKNRATIESEYNSEASKHEFTLQALTKETQRANNYGKHLEYANSQLSEQRNKLSQANSELDDERSRVRLALSGFNEKKNELQQVKTMVANQKAKIRILENSGKHSNCVTKDSVEKVIGSYERLHDFARRKGSRKKDRPYTLHKAHYPNGLGWDNGKYFIKFRDEWF